MTRPTRVLVAEDEAHLGLLLQQFLIGRGHAVTLVHDGDAALAALAAEAFDVALLDVQMPGADGLAVLRAARERPLPPQVVVMTGNGTVDTALAALQHGAYDYVAKPYRMAEVDLLVRRAAERRALERRVAAAEHEAPDEWITRHAPLRELLARVDSEAAATGGALVVGEPGTGRSMLARRMHQSSPAGGALVTLDASRADDVSVEHALDAARSGVLYVRRVERLNAGARRQVARAAQDARLVVSTAAPLDRLALGTELTDAVGGWRVELPPLRDRGGDVPLLAAAFARRFGGMDAPALSAATIERLCAHRWPGNVTELQLVIDGALSRVQGGVVEPADLLLDPV